MNDKEWYGIGLDTSDFKKQARDVRAEFSSIGNSAYNEGMRVDRSFQMIGKAALAYLAADKLKGYLNEIVKIRGEVQQLEIAFETILGSKAKSDKLIAQLVTSAAKTPFDLMSISQGAKQLLAYGEAAETVNGTLNMLGNIASGLSIPLNDLVYLYGTTMTQGRLYTQDLRQFMGRGIPLAEELAKQFGVTKDKVGELVTEGKVGFPEMQKALEAMTSEGGKFFNLMERQSDSIVGLQANLGDAIDMAANDLGKKIEPTIESLLRGSINIVENYEEIGKTILELVAVYGTYKAALITISALNKLNMMILRQAILEKRLAAAASIQLSNAEAIAAARTKTLAIAQKGLVASLKATKAALFSNPYVLAAAAVAGLAFGIYKLVTAETVAEKAQRKHNEELEKAKEAKETLISKTDELISVIDSETETIYAQLKAYKELQKQFPALFKDMDLQEFKSIPAQDRRIKINTEIDNNELKKFKQDYRETLDRIKQLEKEYEFASSIAYPDVAGLTRLSSKIKGEKEILQLKKEQLENEKELRRQADFEAKPDTEKLEYYNAELESLKKQRDEIEQMLLKAEDLTGEWGNFGLQSILNAQKLEDINNKIDETSGKISNLTGKKQEVKNKSFWETQKKEAEEALNAMSESQKGSKEWNDALEKYQQAQNKLKIWDYSDKLKKQLEEEEKARQEQLRAEEEYNNKVLNLNRSMQSSRIEIMKEGAEKRKEEAELEYQKELDRINDQQKAYLEAWNATKGFEPGDTGFVTELPENDLKRFNLLRINAEEKLNQEIEQINRDTATEIESIWKEVNDSFLSGVDADIAAIDAKYDRLIERAEEAGETNIQGLDEAREKEKAEAYINADLEKLRFQEEIEMQRAEISTQGFNRDVEIEKKKLEIVKKFALQKIEILKRSNKKESKLEIEQLELYIESADSGLDELNKKTLSESVYKISEMASAMKDFSDEVFGADSQLASLFNELANGSQILGNIASGNFVGAAAGLLQTIAGWYKQTVTSAEELTRAERETREEAFRINDLYRERLQLLVALGLMSPTEAAVRDVDLLNQKLNDSKQALNSYQQNFLQSGKQTSASIKEIFDTVYGQDWGASELNEALSDWDALFQKYLNIVGGTAFTNHPLSAFNWIFDKEQFNQDLNEVLKYSNEIEITIENLNKKLTSTNTETISDSIIDGFRNGLRSAEGFAESFEGFMRDAMINALAVQYLQEPLKVWQGWFAKFMEDGMIDPEERKKLQEGFYDEGGNFIEGWNQIIEGMNNGAKLLKDLTGTDLFEGKGYDKLTGISAALTEETGSIIAGQFTAMRFDLKAIDENTKQAVDYLMQGLAYQEQIAANTSYNKHLKTIDEKMDQMNRILKDKL